MEYMGDQIMVFFVPYACAFPPQNRYNNIRNLKYIVKIRVFSHIMTMLFLFDKAVLQISCFHFYIADTGKLCGRLVYYIAEVVFYYLWLR